MYLQNAQMNRSDNTEKCMLGNLTNIYIYIQVPKPSRGHDAIFMIGKVINRTQVIFWVTFVLHGSIFNLVLYQWEEFSTVLQKRLRPCLLRMIIVPTKMEAQYKHPWWRGWPLVYRNKKTDSKAYWHSWVLLKITLPMFLFA